MRIFRNLIVLTAVGALAAACSGPDIAMLESMQGKGTAFDKALQAGYTQLAKEELAEYDIADADHYAAKAQRAAAGENVRPDRVIDRKIPAKYIADLEAGWRDLVGMRSNDTRNKMPEKLAEAQTMFDCWIQEAEEDFQLIDISRCQIGFNAAMAELRAGMKPMAAAAPAAKPVIPSKESHMVYFAYNSAVLTPVSKSIIAKAAKSIKSGSKAVFVLGHTDRSGTDDYNKKLSDRRANAVIAELKAQGVTGSISKVVSGERDPAKATDDGVREGLNRRVEIAIVR
jgi:OOP family OmpA-OmpF porin